MNTTLCVAAIIGSVVLTSCATTVARLHGISATDIAEISRVIHAKTSAAILSYEQLASDYIYVDVRGPNGYLVEHVKGKWQINDKKVIVEVNNMKVIAEPGR